jgi:Camelysin metallo-endopeptidase
MSVHPKLMIGAGIAIAGLGLIGAGAGATFTAQVSGNTSISSGSLGLSLNGETGSDVQVGVNGNDLGSNFTPISKDLLLKNTGTLDMASNYLNVTATGCGGGVGAPLAQALNVQLTDVTNHIQVYEGSLCSLASGASEQGFTTPRAHSGVGGQLPHALGSGSSILYKLVLEPNDAAQGLPVAALNTRTSLDIVFTGFDN